MGNQWTKHPVTLEQRFWAKVVKTPDHWLWIGAKGHGGHGHISRGPGKGFADSSRLSWEIHNGPIPAGKNVLHSCIGTPECVNPEHLYLGTQQDNVDDMMEQGRHQMNATSDSWAHGLSHGSHTHPERLSRGERHYHRKLTDDLVREIRSLYASGITQIALGHRFHVDNTTISNVVRRKSWKHVP
jgi:hypothetical protein